MQESQLFLCLYALRHDLESEIVRERYNGHHQRCVVGICSHVTNEGLVDLQGVNGQALQIGKRRETSTKIVD